MKGASIVNIQEREKIESRLAEINNKIRSLGPIMRGSVTLMGKRNKQPYFSVTVKGKTRVIIWEIVGRRSQESIQRTITS